ncbi:hypothetical protein, partial [Kaarinaea lacus]
RVQTIPMTTVTLHSNDVSAISFSKDRVNGYAWLPWYATDLVQIPSLIASCCSSTSATSITHKRILR